MKRRALISVSDKTGVADFARTLSELGFEIISTGGTSAALTQAGIDVTNVSDITGFPECLDGRVKTLHPMVHGGILAMRANPVHMEQLTELGIQPIDIIAINLYPFRQTISNPDVSLEDAIENIDIGGPTMIRAAAKNWQDVTVVIDPTDYNRVLEQLKENGEVSKETKFELAYKVFEHTAQYDALISSYLWKQLDREGYPENLTITFEKEQEMRYGENPHQSAAFYREPLTAQNVISSAKQLNGLELSYNNINDANGAIALLKEFHYDQPAVVAVKHANPCGVGIGNTIFDAYLKAYKADPVSIFGGIVALNREIDEETATELSKTFLEIIIAPSYSDKALEILTKKKKLRLLELSEIASPDMPDTLDMKRVAGGLLVQQLDTASIDEEKLHVVTEREPTPEEWVQLRFVWKVVKHVKSNGIALAKDNATVGIGPGQTNRVTALNLAIKYAGAKAVGSVMGSDAYFPFSDSVEAAQAAGITAIIQPGGSIRDEDSIKAANAAGIAMVFTGIRHFKH